MFAKRIKTFLSAIFASLPSEIVCYREGMTGVSAFFRYEKALVSVQYNSQGDATTRSFSVSHHWTVLSGVPMVSSSSRCGSTILASISSSWTNRPDFFFRNLARRRNNDENRRNDASNLVRTSIIAGIERGIFGGKDLEERGTTV